jgi:hypothetical protein
MQDRLYYTVLHLNDISDTIPLREDHDKLAEVKAITAKVMDKATFKSWLDMIADLEVVNTESTAWLVMKDIAQLE